MSMPSDIFRAVRTKDPNAVATALNNGEDVDARFPGVSSVTESYYTPLFEAVRAGAIETAELLIMRGANVNAISRHGTALIHSASADGNNVMLQLLLQHKADINKINPTCSKTALHCAVSQKRTETVKLLLEHQADINIRFNPRALSPHAPTFTALCATPLKHATAMKQRDPSFPQEIIDLLRSVQPHTRHTK